MEGQFYEAAYWDRAREVKELLRNNPHLDVNWKNKWDDSWTALHIASRGGHDPILAILLAHPNIDVNVKNKSGTTPLMMACGSGSISTVILLLKDARVNINELSQYRTSTFQGVLCDGRLEVIKWWFAAGRELNVDERVVSSVGRKEVETLLTRYLSYPSKTVSEVRKELGITCQRTLVPFFLLRSFS